MPSGTDPPRSPRLPRDRHPLDLTARFEGAQGFLFIFFAVVIPGYGLAFTTQGLDIVKSPAGDFGDPTASLPLFWLCASTAILGFQAWFWARYCVEDQLGERSHWHCNPLLVWAPRAFSAIPFAFLIYAYWKVEPGLPPEARQSNLIALALFVLGLALLTFVIFRQDLTRLLRGRSPAIDKAMDHLRSIVLATSLIVAALLLVVFIAWPVAPAQFFGPCAILLIAMACIIPVMAKLIQLGRKAGKIISVGSSHCTVTVQFKLKDKEIDRPWVLMRWSLPGEHRFDPPLALPG
jgi:hypothetical protein